MSPSAATVGDLVVRLPKTLGPAATVEEAWAAFEDDHVHLLLITEGGRLLGTLTRADLADLADFVDGSEPALRHAVLEDRTLPPALPAEEARQLLIERGERRRAVVDGDGRLLGLLCLKRRLTGYCSDDDVAARAADPTTRKGHAVDPVLVNESGGSLR
jgi:CBS domain-containing protein